METDIINSYHAHVYYDAESMEQARDLCERAAAKFGLRMGHMHEQPVGPHPMWSCQITARPAQFAELLPWLVLNRKGLIVFSHPKTPAFEPQHPNNSHHCQTYSQCNKTHQAKNQP